METAAVIVIKSPEVERRARELAAVTGESLTAAIDGAVRLRLERLAAEPARRPTIAEAVAATERFRQATGLDTRKIDSSKAAFDDLWAGCEGLARGRD